MFVAKRAGRGSVGLRHAYTMPMAELECRHFNGYKPCGLAANCDRLHCHRFETVTARVLIVHLEALGAVLRSTSLIPAIQRAYPRAHITWITKVPAQRLLEQTPGVDRVLTVGPEALLELAVLDFDVAFVIDKSLAAVGVLKHAKARHVRGFTALASGAIVPANSEARELWELGLNDQKKFFENTKSEQRLVHEALALGRYARDEYQAGLSASERALARTRREAWQTLGCGPIIGLNTGSSATLPAKKLSVEGHRRLIHTLRADRRLRQAPIVLLGGPEDTERNLAIADGLDVVLSPTDRGLRDGLASVEACDLVFSGDSLGMHMAIARRKWVVAWFGPTCAQEIDLYDRGVKLKTTAPCAPCWKRSCQKSVMCYDQLDLKSVCDALAQGATWLTSSSKPLIPETSFSVSL